MEIKLYNPFSIRTQDIFLDQIQEIMYYAESRFRQALLAISRANVEKQDWMMDCLCNETVSLIAFITFVTYFSRGMSRQNLA
jgi:hypothetical protein